VVSFYKQLFGSSPHKGVHLSHDFWDRGQSLDGDDKDILERHFSRKEVEIVISGMKTETAPGPNGFIVIFFKNLWKYIKNEVVGMVSDFNGVCLDLKRLNYGVITLVPKTREANTFRQYMPIYLLNVDFKIFLKLLAERITPMADKIISESQTAFIKGRNILEGVVILHEVIHELKK
jgi:hypothetical protein